jgi:hypothetical protein
MKNGNVIGIALGLAVLSSAAAGCRAEEATGATAPDAEESGLETHQTISSNGWNMSSYAQGIGASQSVIASATFWGTPYATRNAGVCAIRQYRDAAGQAVGCNTASECGTYSAPASLPPGGSRYCTSPDGVGPKTCFYRPGPGSTYCAGTPATGSPIQLDGSGYAFPITVPPAPLGSIWIAYGCFEGCGATDPSSSSSTTVLTGCFGGDGYSPPFCI